MGTPLSFSDFADRNHKELLCSFVSSATPSATIIRRSLSDHLLRPPPSTAGRLPIFRHRPLEISAYSSADAERVACFTCYTQVTILIMEPIPEVNESDEMYGLVDHIYDALTK
ncbi:unnamed protein product [Cuscuta campestris]|uniref:Uncharacterized protein n=1 Tax=Cuscuta campestris TaxID=132261 RepID=A0A484MVB8_9ASTE|nr:unnamed protein product [Cuscuta campestris]